MAVCAQTETLSSNEPTASTFPDATADGTAGRRVPRHALVDRVFHWVMAAAMFTLLATGFLPILGVEFAWVTIHWIAGLVLTAAVLFHIVRATFWQQLGSMWVGLRDLRDAWEYLRWNLRISGAAYPLPGKYSLAQKLYHHVVTVFVLVAIVTGLLMMVRIDTPFWERDPYWLDGETWGIVYVVHGFSALCFITLILLHIYFAVRPEKLMYLRSMLRGWITRTELEQQHDPGRWVVDD